jgi:hypothetical protein
VRATVFPEQILEEVGVMELVNEQSFLPLQLLEQEYPEVPKTGEVVVMEPVV